MAVAAKICGLTTPAAVTTAVRNGAAFVGFMSFPPSPRHIAPAAAAELARLAGPQIKKVAVLVDPSDDNLAALVAHYTPDLFQLHGREDGARLAAIRKRFGIPVMKALSVASAEDVAQTRAFELCADYLLFDAKAPEGSATPGGNAVAFDWALLAGQTWRRPWMLAGGLTADNVAQAVRASGATLVDVSSGVEERRGVKSLAKIEAFLAAVRRLNEKP
jgi:phosphoribosylanthranilate isomerase